MTPRSDNYDDTRMRVHDRWNGYARPETVKPATRIDERAVGQLVTQRRPSIFIRIWQWWVR